MTKRNIVIGYRMFFGLLSFSAVVTEIATLIERGRFNPYNFFSFFTVEANLFAAAIFILGSLALARGAETKRLAMLRSASTLYMVITGIVFTVLLAGLDAELTAVPWDNTVLHYIMPIAVLLDWVIYIPSVRIAFKQGLIWIVFPLVYVVYILIRGYLVGWYPYPFLNPGERGYTGVAVTSVAIALVAAALVLLLTRVTMRSAARKAV